MSSYLLLRNNKESGPFTIEEIKAMSLKAYDLVWVVAKSAAWRYPGEIAEFQSFAPPVPEQLTDLLTKRPEAKKPESAKLWVSESNGQRVTTSRSIYVNMPREKKPSVKSKDRIQFEPDFPIAIYPESAYDFSDLYKKKSYRPARISANILWVSTVALLFGAGILTGLFISDRRKFFSVAEKPTQHQELIPPAVSPRKQENEHSKRSLSPSAAGIVNSEMRKDSVKSRQSISGKLGSHTVKKTPRPNSESKDSTLSSSTLVNTFKLNDSLAQFSSPKTDPLYQKIKTHPENYVDLVTGRYTTGVFGGISSFPISLTNNSPVTLDLVVLQIDYIQSNEKIFKTENLSFHDLEPGETVTLKAPKSTRGVRINTRIQLVNFRQLDLSSSN